MSSATPKQGGSLTFGIDTEESGFSPVEARWDEGGYLYGRTLFDPLAVVNSSGGIEPYLAQSITSNADYTVWTVTLRPGISFHDGTPLDANALNLNFEKQATSTLLGPAFADNIASTAVTGPLSVAVTMKNPWAPFPYYLAQGQTGYVAAPSMLNSPNGNENPVGTGPFVFEEWVPNSHMTANRNPHYWRKGYPYLDTITYKPIINSSSRDQALETGEIDIEHTGSPESILLFRGNRKWSYYDNSGQVLGQPTVQCIMLNTSAPPFDNHSLRLAMAKATNQKQFVAVINKNVDAPMHGLFIPGSPYYSPTSYPTYDPAGAAKLVKQVAQSGRAVSFTLNSTSAPDVLRAAQFLQQAWQAGRHAREHQHRGAVGSDQQRPGRQVPGHLVAPVRRRGPRPELRVVDPVAGHGPTGPQHGPQRRSTDRDGAPGRAQHHRARRARQGVPADQPVPGPGHARTCGWPATRGPSSPTPRCRTSPTRTPPRDPRPSPTTRVCSGPLRSG